MGRSSVYTYERMNLNERTCVDTQAATRKSAPFQRPSNPTSDSQRFLKLKTSRANRESGG